MRIAKKKFSWAADILSLEMAEPTTDLRKLVEAARLNPFSDDISSVDLSGLDLRNQNLSGWNLKHASFKESRLAGASLEHASLDPYAVSEAHDWDQAILDVDIRTQIERISKLKRSVIILELSVRSQSILERESIDTLSDLVQKSEAEMLRLPNFGRRSLNEIKERLAQQGLYLGMQFER